MTPEIKRKQDETVENYLLRLGNNKDAYQINWYDIRDLMNSEASEDFSESKWRKDFSLIKKGFDLCVKNGIQSDEYLNEIKDQQIELQKERVKLQSVKVEYNKFIREDSRKELMFDMIKQGIEKLPVPEFQSDNYFPQQFDKAGILSFGDIHFGKIFKSISNEYSEEIAKERMQQLLYEVLDIINQQGFNQIHIINGADSIEGMSLRVSQLQSISIGFVDQTIKFSKFIAAWLNELSKYVNIVYHHVPSANHSEIRPFNSKRGEFPAEDLEKVIMHYVHDVLENNPRIEVPIYESDIVKLDVLGYKVWALHGHQLKGIKNAIRDLSVKHREFIDFLYVAHFHHKANLTVGEGLTNDVEVINIPSVMGTDEYADSLFTGAKAGADLSVYLKGKGRYVSYNIHLN